MKKSTVSLMTILLTMVAVCFFCTDIPDPPITVHSGANVEFFSEDDLFVDSTGIKRIGAALTYPQLISAITVSSPCVLHDTTIPVQSSKPLSDTIYFTLSFTQPGACTLFASVITEDPVLKAKMLSMTLYVSTISKTANPETPLTPDPNGTILAPEATYAPENVISGKGDTLEFLKGATLESITLITNEPIDPAVFTVLSAGPEAVRIAVNPEATTGKANIGIVASDGTRADTSWYPVSIISQDAALWNITELPVEAVEGEEIQLPCTPYLINPEAVVTSDIGMISSDNIWSFIPPWGSEETMTAKITAKTASASMTLTLNLTIPAGDITPPVITLKDASFQNGKRISAQQIPVECTVEDIKSGVSSVVYTFGEQHIEATPQGENSYSGAISGLKHNIPVEVTITATDRSRTQNTAAIVFTVTYDSTMTDGESPIIAKINGPEPNGRVNTAEGMISYTVTDASGVDSVWWTLNDVFAGALGLQEDGTYTLSYTLTTSGENNITLHAQDAAASNNPGYMNILLIYNVAPTVPVIETPEAGATGIATSPTLTWTGGDDPDQDPVLYLVHYKKSTETVFIPAPVSAEKSATLTGLEPNTEYTWKVLAYTETYPDSVECEPVTFTTAGTGPAISTQPTKPAGKIEPGGSFTLEIVAIGTPEPTYQWYHNGGALAGKTKASITVSNASKDDAGEYYVEINNGVGDPVKSSTVTIEIMAPVKITRDPEDQDVLAGEDATFTVEADGDGTLTYQWMKGGSPVAGQTSATCKLTGVTTAQAGSYTCKVSNGSSEATSSGATLKVTETVTLKYNTNQGSGNIPEPKKYAKGSSVTIEGNENGITRSGLKCVGWGDNISTYHRGDRITLTADKTLYAVWVATVTFKSDGAEVAKATAYQGKAVDKFPSNPSKKDFKFEGWYTDGGQKFTSSSTVNSSMTVTARWKKTTVAPKIVNGLPSSKTVNSGGSVTLSVTINSDVNPQPSYKWTRNGTQVGTGSSYSISSAKYSDEGTYKVVVSNTDGYAESSTKVTVKDKTPPRITLNGPSNQKVCYGDPAWKDPGASATDDKDGSVKVNAVPDGDMSQPGIHTVTYTATDNSNNTATVKRTVKISTMHIDNMYSTFTRIDGRKGEVITLAIQIVNSSSNSTMYWNINGEIEREKLRVTFTPNSYGKFPFEFKVTDNTTGCSDTWNGEINVEKEDN